MRLDLPIAAIITAALFSAPATLAGEAGEITRDALYAGTLAKGLEALGPLADSGDAEAQFGLGTLTFFSGIEHLSQALYRHGLNINDAGAGPILSVPVLSNPNPEPLDYDKVRGILARLVTDMDAARPLLESAGEAGDYVVMLDPTRFRIDINGDGMGDENESVGAVITMVLGEDAGFNRPMPPRDTPDGNSDAAKYPEAIAPDMTFGFDRADAIWLAGYSQIFATQADFMLAHDFSGLVNSAFHRLFPKAGLPMQDYAAGGRLMMDPESDAAIADAIAAIHTMNWPITDTEKFKGILTRLHTITTLSRRNWSAIEAETDDNAEFIPSPRQSPKLPGGEVSEAMVAAWRATLDTADQILAGKLLIPHWRFKQGFDLNAYFSNATRTDIVMLLTGYDALPFLKDGPIASADSFEAANRVFGDNLLGYAFWFN